MTDDVRFIGIDLGWRTGESGLCCLELDAERLQLNLLSVTRRLSLTEIFAWLDDWLPSEKNGLVAVDAPTLIPNATGTRLPDRMTHQYFGKYHAGCYPANLGRPFAERTVTVGLELERRGFCHSPTIIPQQPGRLQIEVFPHPAMVHLFQLNQIIKYKKGSLAQKKPELMRFQTLCQQHLSTLTPAIDCQLAAIQPLWRSPMDLKGKDLKALEDQLDSLICAYVGAYWWYWGAARNWVLGDIKTGYIVVPAPVVQPEGS